MWGELVHSSYLVGCLNLLNFVTHEVEIPFSPLSAEIRVVHPHAKISFIFTYSTWSVVFVPLFNHYLKGWRLEYSWSSCCLSCLPRSCIFNSFWSMWSRKHVFVVIGLHVIICSVYSTYIVFSNRTEWCNHYKTKVNARYGFILLKTFSDLRVYYMHYK